jgi:23S rRNA pseudouridine1911/1915/1917 synthase
MSANFRGIVVKRGFGNYPEWIENSQITAYPSMANASFRLPPSVPEPARNLLAVLQGYSKLTKQDCLQLIQMGAVRVNGRRCLRSFQKLEVADLIEYEWTPQPRPGQPKRSASRETFRVVHDDPEFLVVLKPANLLTVPTPHREARTLISLVSQHLKKTGTGEEAYCVHRLDRGVSGLLIFAKSLAVALQLREQFAARKPDRQYMALCRGGFPRDEGTIRSYLATDEDLNRYSTTDRDRGQLAITHFRVKHRWSDATALEIRLETGRRNQIRVHLAEGGHPILGDPRYRVSLAEHWAWPYRRLALHAESLGFEHPRTGQTLKFRSSWPEEFRDFKRRMDRHERGRAESEGPIT